MMNIGVRYADGAAAPAPASLQSESPRPQLESPSPQSESPRPQLESPQSESPFLEVKVARRITITKNDISWRDTCKEQIVGTLLAVSLAVTAAIFLSPLAGALSIGGAVVMGLQSFGGTLAAGGTAMGATTGGAGVLGTAVLPDTAVAGPGVVLGSTTVYLWKKYKDSKVYLKARKIVIESDDWNGFDLRIADYFSLDCFKGDSCTAE